MEFKLEPSKKIYLKNSPIHGLGVFALNDITVNEIIEECPILSLPLKFPDSSPLFIDYRFNWPSGSIEWEEQVLALGFGSFYNHNENPNAYWISDYEKRTFRFICLKDIKKDEEILVYYGDVNYWNDGRLHTQIV